MKTIPKIETVPSIKTVFPSGAGEYLMIRQFVGAPMRIGQVMASLGAEYAPRRGMLMERFTPSGAGLYPPKPRLSVDHQATGILTVRREDRGPSAVRVPDRLALDDATAETLVELLANYWVEDTQFDSSFEAILSHPAARGLIAIGRPLVPFALDRLDTHPERWSYVLGQITGGKPMPCNAQREDAARIWSDWLRTNNWI